MVPSPYYAAIITLCISIIWLFIIFFAVRKNVITSFLGRKINHIGTGIIFILCWLLFPINPISRYLATAIPLGIVLIFSLAGAGIIRNDAIVKSMSRSGERKELLLGPMFYGIAFVLITFFFWKSIHAIISLTILSVGDGMAEVIGARWTSMKIPWSKRKSIAGSLTFIIFGLLSVLIMIWIFQGKNSLMVQDNTYPIKILIIVLLAAGVESLPFLDIDNLSIPIISILSSLILFPGSL